MLIALLGGGQLARMLALAGIPLGLRFRVLDPAPDPCAAAVAQHVRGEFTDQLALAALLEDASVLGFDFENVPASALEWAQQHLPCRPGPAVLAMTQDRLLEKQGFAGFGVEVAPFWPIQDAGQVRTAMRQAGGTVILKTRRFGYDGKGQVRVDDPAHAQSAYVEIGQLPAIAEGLVDFERELSLLAVRGADGEMRCWPLVENVHVHGMLALSMAGASVTAALRAQAEAAARAVAEHFDYVGVFALEFFEVGGRLVLNEMAPRVHNSGHWTIEGSSCSQFENHLRALLGWPLGACDVRTPAAMLNLIGQMPKATAALAIKGAHWHDYGKKPRRGRKVGHVTLTAPDRPTLVAHLQQLLPACGLEALAPRLLPALERCLTS